jgi:hypothetical protein
MSKDCNGVGSDQVECLGIQNRNTNTDSGENPSPKPKPVDTQNPIGYPKPATYGNVVRAISTFYKYIHNIYNIHMYKQEVVNSK